jgi:DNA-binding NarL/FixJ family response regulator
MGRDQGFPDDLFGLVPEFGGMLTKERAGLRFLILEDDPHDAELEAYALRRVDPSCAVQVVDSRGSFSHALESFAPDVILSDSGVAGFQALDALHLLQSNRPSSPLLLVSGTLEQTGTACLKAGAADYVPKADLARLGYAIRVALEVRTPLRRLSTRQSAVFQRLASGESTKEIASHLRISVKTIETHRAQVMRRLEIRDLAGLVRYAIRVGVVSADR